MSDFPSLPQRGHRTRFAAAARVPLATSYVTPANLARVNGWKARLQQSRGLILDRVIEHAHTSKLFPSTRTKK
jgi:hypothetical protein